MHCIVYWSEDLGDNSRTNSKGSGVPSFVTALVKNPCKKYKTKVMGHVFQVEWWEKHPSRCSFLFIIAKEIGKGFGKA